LSAELIKTHSFRLLFCDFLNIHNLSTYFLDKSMRQEQYESFRFERTCSMRREEL